MKQVIICADDYGYNAAVNAAIIELASKQRITATSCMTTVANWAAHANALNHHLPAIDLGLHFNLTEGQPLSRSFRRAYPQFPSLAKLLMLTQLRRLSPAIIADEFKAQLNQFTDTIGQYPTFIDGHHHIINCPQIREVVLTWLQKIPKHRPWIRLTNQSMRDIGQAPLHWKRWVTGLMGGWQLYRLVSRLPQPHNHGFQGFYNFTSGVPYRTYFKQFLAHCQNQSLIMCHPGYESTAYDPIAKARLQEYQYLKSAAFPIDCRRYQIKLIRPSQLHAPLTHTS